MQYKGSRVNLLKSNLALLVSIMILQLLILLEERNQRLINTEETFKLKESKEESKFKISFKTILMIIVIIVGGILLWFFYFKKKTASVPSLETSPVIEQQTFSIPQTGIDENIISKINNIPLW